MRRTFTFTMTALAAALALAACDRGDRSETAAARGDNASATSTARTTPSTAPSGTTASTTTSPSTSSGGTVSGAGTSAAAGTTTSGSVAAGSQLPTADSQFVTKAAAGGQFEIEIAKLAADKATDPQVKSFAQMLVDDHTAANEKLRQIAGSHNVALPASLPADKKKQIDQLGKLSGAEFDRQFVKMVGIQDHQHDIDEFEKAAKSAKSDDVRDFAQSTLPTLKKHLAAAQNLPEASGRAKS